MTIEEFRETARAYRKDPKDYKFGRLKGMPTSARGKVLPAVSLEYDNGCRWICLRDESQSEECTQRLMQLAIKDMEHDAALAVRRAFVGDR